MAAKGQEEPFRPQMLSDGKAPIAAIGRVAVNRPSRPHSRHSLQLAPLAVNASKPEESNLPAGGREPKVRASLMNCTRRAVGSSCQHPVSQRHYVKLAAAGARTDPGNPYTSGLEGE
jgi:hypothetical protein